MSNSDTNTATSSGEVHPVPLLSLDEMIKSNRPKNRKDSKNLSHGNKSYTCFDCQEVFGSSTDLYEHKNHHCQNRKNSGNNIICFNCRSEFHSVSDLRAHKASSPSCQPNGPAMHGKRSREQPKSAPKPVTISYTWLAANTAEESLLVGVEAQKLLQIFSSGDVVIDGSVEHSKKYFAALNLCLKPLKMHIIFEGSVADKWSVKGGTWSLPLDGERYPALLIFLSLFILFVIVDVYNVGKFLRFLSVSGRILKLILIIYQKILMPIIFLMLTHQKRDQSQMLE